MKRVVIGAGLLAVVLATATACWFTSATTVPGSFVEVGRPPRIDPDYSGCTIPANIAPLNFAIHEEGTRYCVRVSGEQGEPIVVGSREGGIALPVKQWRSILEQNRGGRITLDIFVCDKEAGWQHFSPIVNNVAAEDIDACVAYRRIKPVHNLYDNMGTYERDLATDREWPILQNPNGSQRCSNCHTFADRNPDTMVLHIRGRQGNLMLLGRKGTITKVDTKSPISKSPATYATWHPNGRLLAFSINSPALLHHAVGDSRDVLDYDSSLVLYDAETHRVSSPPQLSDPDYLETFPAWSPDGKYLYFCRAPRLWRSDLKEKKLVPANHCRVHYDLYRVAFDVESGRWGRLERLLDAADTGLSINEPRVSPDGRFVLFCMHDYGTFPVYQNSSDLYLMDTKTLRWWRPDINSPRSDSWHSWSSNSRWIVFASKRRDGLFGRLYFSYVTPDGTAQKPFLLPQGDPKFYESFLENFNAPEFVQGPVDFSQEQILEAIQSGKVQKVQEEKPKHAYDPLVDGHPVERRALAELCEAVKLQPDRADLQVRLGREREAWNQIDPAIQCYQKAIDLTAKGGKTDNEAMRRLAWLRATHPREDIRNGSQALQMLEGLGKQGHETPELLDAMAAAYAEMALYRSAVDTAAQAERLAKRAGDSATMRRIHSHLEFYRADEPYRDCIP